MMCAPNGARKTKDDHPAIPITPAELAECAVAILEAGASIMHVHVRDANGGHTLDVDRYRDAIDAIRARAGDQLVIQVTTEACGMYAADQQMAVVRELRPEAVSVALKEVCPDDASEPVAAAFYDWMQREGVFAQHILYSPEETARFESLRARGIIADESPFVLFVLGRYSSDLTGDVGELDDFIARASSDTRWAVCSFGRTEHEAVTAAAKAGGHARVGFENNLRMPDGREAADNTALVAAACSAAAESGRAVANADTVREMFAGSRG